MALMWTILSYSEASPQNHGSRVSVGPPSGKHRCQPESCEPTNTVCCSSGLGISQIHWSIFLQISCTWHLASMPSVLVTASPRTGIAFQALPSTSWRQHGSVYPTNLRRRVYNALYIPQQLRTQPNAPHLRFTIFVHASFTERERRIDVRASTWKLLETLASTIIHRLC